MSNDKTPTVQAVPVETTESDVKDTAEKRPNAFVRAYRATKQNPKTALAVVAGTALVGVSAYLGRATAPLHVQIVESDFEPEPLIETPVESDDKSA